jgi:hypothetical protein
MRWEGRRANPMAFQRAATVRRANLRNVFWREAGFRFQHARRLVERFEWHSTPKHGSWLDMAESQLNVLSNQCLDRRIPDPQTSIREIAAWEKDRNKHYSQADWQLTAADARITLKHLYPSI